MVEQKWRKSFLMLKAQPRLGHPIKAIIEKSIVRLHLILTQRRSFVFITNRKVTRDVCAQNTLTTWKKVMGAGTSSIFMIEHHSVSISNSWVLDTGCDTHICLDLWGLKECRRLKHGEKNLIMGNRWIATITKIGEYSLMLSNEVSISLVNCSYSSNMKKNKISFHDLFKNVFLWFW